MKIEELKQEVADMGHENSMFFENPDYADAITGISSDGNVCYQYDKMVECLMDEDGMTDEEAAEYIDYNTVRSLEYMRQDENYQWPIIIYRLPE